MNTARVSSIVGVLSLVFFSQVAVAQPENFISSALECRGLSMPKDGAFFSANDLPIHKAISQQPDAFKKKGESQGEDGQSLEIVLSKSAKVFGVEVSTIHKTVSMEGVFQSVLLNIPDITTFRELVEKELSIKFANERDRLVYFNPENGLEYSITTNTSASGGYYFSCGRNSLKFDEISDEKEKELLKKEKAEKEAKEKLIKQQALDAFLAKNLTAIQKSVDDIKIYQQTIPLYASLAGALLIALGFGIYYFSKSTELDIKAKLKWTSWSAGGVGAVVMMASGYQFIFYQIRPDISAGIRIWNDTRTAALSSATVHGRFIEYGDLFAKSDSIEIAANLADIYSKGEGVVPVNADKAAYYRSIVDFAKKRAEVAIAASQAAAAKDRQSKDGPELSKIFKEYLNSSGIEKISKVDLKSSEFLYKGHLVSDGSVTKRGLITNSHIAKFSITLTTGRTPRDYEQCVSFLESEQDIGVNLISWLPCSDIAELIRGKGKNWIIDYDYQAETSKK